MVTVVKETKLVEKIVKVEEEVITLTLNKTEACVVKTLIGNVTGTQNSYRKLAEQIYDALAKQGVETLFKYDNKKFVEGVISFNDLIHKDYPLEKE